MDLFPTYAEIAGVKVKNEIEGKSRHLSAERKKR